MDRRRTFVELAWIVAPYLAFLAVLQHLWTDAPMWDDYDAILGLILRDDQVHSWGEWVAMIFGQHNEHRIAVTRLVTLGVTRLMGHVDFRLLMLVGDLSLVGIMLLLWREFRRDVPAAVLGGAAIAMFQFSYYEACLMGSAAMPHLGVVFFSLACLFFALREGRASLPLAVLFGALAAASQANGVLALPIAAAGCLFWRRPARAAVLATLAVLAWWLYFRDFVRPANHPSPLVAFAVPISTFHLFCVVIGGILPGTRNSALLGLAMLAALAWLAWKGEWRRRPVVTLWVLFLVATAGAAAVGRVGLGVVQASRYAVVSTTLLVIIALSLYRRVHPEGEKGSVYAVALGVLVAAWVTGVVWDDVRLYALRGRILSQPVPDSPALQVERYGGVFFPDPARAQAVLVEVAAKGYYHPRRQAVHAPRVVAEARLPQATRIFGHVDTAVVTGHRLAVTGWSDIPATVPGRTMHVRSSPPFADVASISVISRQDVAFIHLDAGLVYAGFEVHLDYASEDDARQAAKDLCIVVEAPGRPVTRLIGHAPDCGYPGA